MKNWKEFKKIYETENAKNNLEIIINKFENETTEDSYEKELEEFEKNYDGNFSLIIKMVNYISQVRNGGHQQYFDNNYTHSLNATFPDIHEKMVKKLNEMIKTFENKLSRRELIHLQEFYEISNYFLIVLTDYEEDKSCQDCNGSGEIEEEGEIEFCNFCNGSGEVPFEDFTDLDRFDHKLFAIDDDVEKILEKIAGYLLN